MTPNPDQRSHPPGPRNGWAQWWSFDFAQPGGVAGFVRLTHFANQGRSWYWAYLVLPGRELVVVRESLHDENVAYERLLTDAMRGDQALFVRADAIEVSWDIFEDVLEDAGPVHPYEPGTWGPVEADRLVAPLEGWQNPSS